MLPSGVTSTKPVGSTANCAPISALCMFCENAAYAGYWTPDVDTCEPYEGKTKGVCEAVAGAAKGLASKMKPLYAAYGPQFGASGVVCRDGGCCPKSLANNDEEYEGCRGRGMNLSSS